MRTTFSKNVRYLSALILVIFIIGTLASLSLIPSFAVSPFDDEAYLMEDADRIELYLDAENVFESKEAKLATMSERVTVGNFTLYVDTTTGEVAVKNQKTGQILSTNPYDVASAPDAVKQKLMNQLVVSYCNVKDNKPNEFGSFADAALRKQITVKNIKNGLRVEYTLGREASKQLVPGWVEYNRFKTLIYEQAYVNCYTETEYQTVVDKALAENIKNIPSIDYYRGIRYNRMIGGCYSVIDPYNLVNHAEIGKTEDDSMAPSDAQVKSWLDKYDCLSKEGISDYNMDGVIDNLVIVIIDETAKEYQRNQIESAIKQFTSYSYEDLTYDTNLTGYVSKDTNPALFRMVLEYTLTEEDGLEVRLPANSIRFDEDAYRLISVDVLPYFGATANDYTGYNFIPDGSGMIIRNEEIMNDGRNDFSIRGQIYGPDFAYHDITKYYNGKSEIMRLPVFGSVQDTVVVTDNMEKQLGYIWVETAEKDNGGNNVYYTSTDRIMLDAVNSKGELITTLEEYLAQFKVDETTGDVIRVGDPLWDSPNYVGTIPVGDEDPLSEYNKYVENGEVPYIELVNKDAEGNPTYLMAPLVGEDGKVVTYKGQTVYTYVDAEGNPVDAENRVEGLLKIKEQLWYKGQPAYYNTDVPVDPVEDTMPNPGETPDIEGTPEEGETPDADETPDTDETPEEGETDEEIVEVKMYNDVLKMQERYDDPAFEEIETVVSEGYFAIITEGDALCNITSAHGGQNPETATGGEHKYNSVYISVFPRPQDTYRLADAISVSNDSTEWVVVSDRKYTGSYRIKYVMLSDATYVEDGTVKKNEYGASYVEMARVYRDYLIKKGVLSPLENLDDDIPLYLEAFGMTTTTKVVATIPIVADAALTSFNDLKTIYEDLSTKENIDNINFRLTGFSKGGLYSYAPSELKFESVVGGNKGYKSVVKYAKEVSAQDGKNLGIFPDFDFANVERVGWFDEFDSLDDSSRTIDDRYASKREYNATYQTFSPVGSVTVSPSAFKRLFKVFAKEMDSIGGVSGLSVGSLGTDLNSDFDVDDPYNREDSRYYTEQVLQMMVEKYGKVMIDGGNAYALAYADYILNMPLDSTGYARASTSIPFMGMLLHGYINYAGEATGMASDIDKEILRIIENGAAPYFTIAFKNDYILKEDRNYSDYYAISYKNSYNTIVEKYNLLNEVLADVQTATITDHKFLTGIRSLGENELNELGTLLAIAATEKGYTEARNAAIKDYNNRKALAERHGEVFDEIFEETYPWFVNEYNEEDAENITADYLKHIEEDFKAAIDREIKGNKIVLVEYTRKDGTTKTFILNYEAYEVTVNLGGEEILIGTNDFKVVGQ